MNRGDETHYEAQLESLQKFFAEFMLKQFEYDILITGRMRCTSLELFALRAA